MAAGNSTAAYAASALMHKTKPQTAAAMAFARAGEMHLPPVGLID
jgi:hypothetical protein